MNLPKSFSPLDEVLGHSWCKNASFHRLGDGPWEGQVTTVVDGVRRDFTVEELSTGWRVTRSSGRNVTGTSLIALLKRAAGTSS